MSQSLVSLLVHLVFSTKHRANLITPEVEPELFAYMAGILKHYESPCLAMNGTANHVHILISQSKNVALSFLIGELKKSSSLWIKTKGLAFRRFHWQDGYGAFSIGESGVAVVKEYMARQKEKHKKRSFEEEFIALLKKYRVAYEERYLWD